MNFAPETKLGKRTNLDIIQVMRFIAALSVVMVHFPESEMRSWGVDLFFIISGFIMCYTTQWGADHFFLKRVLRVVPLYWLLTFVFFFLSAYFSHLLNSPTSDLPSLLKSLFFIPFENGDDGHSPLIFLGWTLNYEMLFYSLFAIALLFGLKHRTGAVSILVLICIVTANYFYVEYDSFVGEIWSSPIILEFLYGVLIFQVLFSRASPPIDTIVTVVSIIVIAYFLDIDGSNRAVGYGLPLLVISYLLIRFLGGLKINPTLTFFGDASYALYLIHPFVIQYYVKVLCVFEENSEYITHFTILAVISCLVVSGLLFYFIEKPLTGVLRRLFIKKRVMPIIGA